VLSYVSQTSWMRCVSLGNINTTHPVHACYDELYMPQHTERLQQSIEMLFFNKNCLQFLCAILSLSEYVRWTLQHPRICLNAHIQSSKVIVLCLLSSNVIMPLMSSICTVFLNDSFSLHVLFMFKPICVFLKYL